MIPGVTFAQAKDEKATLADSTVYYFIYMDLLDGRSVLADVDSMSFNKERFKTEILQFEKLNTSAFNRYLNSNLGSFRLKNPGLSIFVFNQTEEGIKKEFQTILTQRKDDLYRPPNFKYIKTKSKALTNPKRY